jgi:hypothetical protein
LKRTRKIANLIALLLLLSAVLLSGCSPGGEVRQPGDGSHVAELPPLNFDDLPYVIPEILLPYAPGTSVSKNEKAVIDFSNMHDGYIMVRFFQETDRQVRVLITVPDETEYVYRLVPGGDYEVFPLSGGDGEYMIRVFEQVEDTRFALVNMTTIYVELENEFSPFLRPNQFVNFHRGSEVVRKAAELTMDAEGFWEKVTVIYRFIIENIEYDMELAATVQSGYVPDLDSVLERGMGICFDFASVMTAMLRSQGIPTRLVIRLYRRGVSRLDKRAFRRVRLDKQRGPI